MGKSRPSGPFADGFWWLDGPVDRIECTIGRDGYEIQCELYVNKTGMREIFSLRCHGLCRKRSQTEIVFVHPKCDEHRWNALVHGNTRGTDHWGNVVFVAMLVVDQRHRSRHETTRFRELPAALQRSIHESQGGILLGHQHDDCSYLRKLKMECYVVEHCFSRSASNHTVQMYSNRRRNVCVVQNYFELIILSVW